MRKALMFCPLLLAAGAAHADDILVYIGAGATNGTVHNVLGSGLNIDNTEYKIFTGFRPVPGLFGAEFEYLDFGSQSNTVAHGAANAYALDAVGYLPVVPRFLDVYGKAGLSYWELSGDFTRPGVFMENIDDSGVRFTFGVGAQARFGNWSARLEYEHFSVGDSDGANILTLGLQINW